MRGKKNGHGEPVIYLAGMCGKKIKKCSGGRELSEEVREELAEEVRVELMEATEEFAEEVREEGGGRRVEGEESTSKVKIS